MKAADQLPRPERNQCSNASSCATIGGGSLSLRGLQKYIKPRYDDHPENGTDQHTSGSGSPDRSVADGSGARSHDERDKPCDECKGGHQDRPKTFCGAFEHCFDHGTTFFLPDNGVFHDQDRIFYPEDQ